MTAYDDWKTTDTQADADAKRDAALDAARWAVVVTGWELGESLTMLSDDQFQLFCIAVAESDCPVIKAQIKVICADIIERKAKQMGEVGK